MGYSNSFCLWNQDDYGTKMIKVLNNVINQPYVFKKRGEYELLLE